MIMTETGYMSGVTITPQSPVNGAKTRYNFEVIPNFEVISGDSFFVRFPDEVVLPLSYYMEC